MPKLPTPFKCYIYCTKAPKGWVNLGTNQQLDSKVVAEFTCNSIERFDVPYPAYQSKMRKDILERSCVGYYPMHRYAYHDDLYAWDISDLKIYNQPKVLFDFNVECSYSRTCKQNCQFLSHTDDGAEYCGVYHWKPIIRPPQSWRYVEELEKE